MYYLVWLVCRKEFCSKFVFCFFKFEISAAIGKWRSRRKSCSRKKKQKAVVKECRSIYHGVDCSFFFIFFLLQILFFKNIFSVFYTPKIVFFLPFWGTQSTFGTSMHKIKVPALSTIKCGRNSLVGLSYTRKDAEKDVGKFIILFVARLFTF